MEIRFETNITKEQKDKVIEHYAQDKFDSIHNAKSDPIFLDFKDFFRIHWKEILRDPSNAHLRREVVNT